MKTTVRKGIGSLCCAATFLLVACVAGRIERAIAKADELRGTQQYASALRAYELIVLEYPQHPRVAEVLLRIGDLHNYTLHDPDRAIDAYQRITRDWFGQPAAAQSYRRLGELFTAREEYPFAVDSYEQFVKYFPADPDWDVIHHAIGVCYLKQKQYVQARIEFFRLAEQERVRPDVRAQTTYDLAETFFLEGKPESAIPYYARVSATFPRHPLAKQAKLQLVHCYGEIGDLAAALALAQELRRQYPEDPAIRARLKQLQEQRATVGRPGKLPWSK